MNRHCVGNVLLSALVVVTCLGCSPRSETEEQTLLVVFEGLTESDEARSRMWSADLLEGLRLTPHQGESDAADWTVHLQLDPTLSTVSDQGALLNTIDSVVHISARTMDGLANGVYGFLADHGVVYLHPKTRSESPILAMPQPKSYAMEISEPTFVHRGFHEHTQHPIPMSVFALEPSPENLQEVREYIDWLARNRQNIFTFHFLNTVDMDAWTPHMTQIVDYAQSRGVMVGVVVGFVDQQQNAYRLVRPTEDGSSDEMQIVSRLTPILDTGLSWIGFQIGSSEFTKPDELVMLDWLNYTAGFVAEAYPKVTPFAWIHITCGLHLANGASYFHLPLQADPRIASFVHTTMFYDLTHPAPVYDCENFQHQMDFVRAANGRREMIYFPETAWWLGFDNNVPLATPIVGPSRHADIQLLSTQFEVNGHVTFTTGREWTYWMYDHYLTRSTWDGTLTWDNYIDEIDHIYGGAAAPSSHLLKTWAQLQWSDFYQDAPLLYFYLSGELPQDELGERAGIVARPAKRSFQSIVDMEPSEYDRWFDEEFETLNAMAERYRLLFETLPPPVSSSTPWYIELYRTYEISSLRALHAVALYSGARHVRSGQKTESLAQLNKAEAITERVLEIVEAQRDAYRYSSLILDEQRSSLTAYDYGYLHETRTAKFWIRRNSQLASLIDETFDPTPEGWADASGDLWLSMPSTLEIDTPDNALLSQLLEGLMPVILIRVEPDPSSFFWLALDGNDNALPDPNSLQQVNGERRDGVLSGFLRELAVAVEDEGGQSLGTLRLLETTVRLMITAEAAHVAFDATLAADNVVDIVAGFGIEPDALGELLKNVWGLDRDQTLPERLPIAFKVELTMRTQ